MPKDLPGFYFDVEKNRYFPIRGPIPGSSRNSSASSSSSTRAANSLSNPNLVKRKSRGIGLKSAKLLQARELYGNLICSSRGRCNFQEEYLKIQASQPEIWKYQLTRGCDVALEQLHVNVQTRDGLIDTDILLGGCSDGSLSVFEAGRKLGERPSFGIKCEGNCVWPPKMGKQKGLDEAPGHLWFHSYTSINMSRSMSSMRVSKESWDGSPSMQHVIITSLGSEESGGSLYTLNLGEPFCFNPNIDTLRTKLRVVTTFYCTAWSADCCFDGSQAAVGSDAGGAGTSLGVALVDLETCLPSWVLRCKSDVLSLQFDYSGKNVLCGLRNGAIVTIDTRQKSESRSHKLTRHQIPFPSRGTTKPSYRAAQSSTNQWFEVKGDIIESEVIFMPSSISCLESLRLYDQYFLASSMDGTIRLYDHRLIQRGPVQSYEGHVNSHTRIKLGIDPYEKLVMSGGEDFKLRLWSIKSGELLYENKVSDLVPSAVCWPKGPVDDMNHNSGAWFASRDQIYHMHLP